MIVLNTVVYISGLSVLSFIWTTAGPTSLVKWDCIELSVKVPLDFFKILIKSFIWNVKNNGVPYRMLRRMELIGHINNNQESEQKGGYL